MTNFIIRRLIYGILVLFGVVSVVFFLFNIKPGDPARMMGGQHVSEEAIHAIRKDLGLDLPLHQQYLLYLNDLSPVSVHNEKNRESHIYLDDEKFSYSKLFAAGEHKTVVIKYPYLRRSYQSKKLVSEIVAESLPGTIILASTSILLGAFLGIIFGVVAAINKGSFFDNSSLSLSVLGMSNPSFFTAIIIQWIFGYLWADITNMPALPFICMGLGLLTGYLLYQMKGKDAKRPLSLSYLLKMMMKGLGIGFALWFGGIAINGLLHKEALPLLDLYITLPGTHLNMTGSLYEIDVFKGEYMELTNLILPALTLGLRPISIVLQLTRSSMLDVLSQDYIRTATAKGLNHYRVIFKHALKNALNPVVTAVSGWFAALMAGAVFVESVFGWKGIGFEVVNALQKDDLPVVMGAVLVIATMFVLINIIVDIIYGLLDPRVRV